MKKSTMVLFSSAFACLVTYAPISRAQTIQAVESAPTRLILNGQDASNPAHLVRPESSTSEPTSWLPIWYLFKVLSELNIRSTWDGHHWNLVLPSGMHADLTNPPKDSANSSDVSIEINGTPVDFAPRYAHRDPSGRVVTSYIPIWYLMQALNRVGITSTWDGTTWSMTTSESSPTETKLTVVKDFANALNIQPDATSSNPFDDVSASDWPYVNAVLQKGYFTADSSSHFGSADSVNAETVDHAYQLYVGIPDSDLSWNAGGSTIAWANAVELNQGLANGTLTSTGEAQMMSNLSALYHGYSKNANGTYRVWFQPYDAKKAFAHDNYVTAAMASKGQSLAFPLVDAIQFSVQSTGHLEFQLPSLSDQDLRELSCGSLFNATGNHTEYSVNGGQTWAVTSGFAGYDSRDPSNGGVVSPPKTIWVKTEGHAEMDASYIYPKDDVVFASIGMTPGSDGGVPKIQYSSGQAAWGN
ncbi:hypothetical protein [Ferroacidibacillus organovorans]|uniref:Copper amine oxidase-like N-terminal domain-containing protein n=1 Tax=Ferroacidibacillus organovorans TaxID=1765683 RepID=A0A853KCP0_9BACL|nr:hypothetical protein [Ferroacidibacillus organovorans]KYP79885.1 hypothetical protein AYJ22_03020 [Ferroacidibacillus organovorans]OAG94637.1 hypothetical protein AYW79_04595 [Ferroacidibacillus organovorans]